MARTRNASKANLIRALAQKRGLDPAAVIAVAIGEGGLVNRQGDIGDLSGGGSYGPFQLYAQGALPRRYRGNPSAADRWAWSPQGIAYALDQMVKVGARGLRGGAAVRKIITDFERPADPQGSIQKALARLGSGPLIQTAPLSPVANAASNSLSRAGSVANDSARRRLIAQGLLNDEDIMETVQKIGQLPLAQGQISLPTNPRPNRVNAPGGAATALGQGFKGIAELFYDPIGGVKRGRSIGAIGGHPGHVHAAFENPQRALLAIRLAQQMGLRVGENPFVDPVDPVHTSTSYHYRTFKKRYKGRRLGKGIDVSGDRAKMAAYFRRLSPVH